jgi:hypothetical protein
MELLFALLPYYLCMVAGLIMVGGGIWLLAKGKIILDAKTGEVVDFDFPLVGKFKTNVPVLGLFLIGFIPLIYPIPNIPKVMNGRTAAEHERDEAISTRVQAQQKLEALQKQLPRPIMIQAAVESDTYPVTFYAANKMTELEKGEEKLVMHVPVYEGLEEYRIIGRIGSSIIPPSVVGQDMLQTSQNPIILKKIVINFNIPREGFEINGPLTTVESPPPSALSSPPPAEYRPTETGSRESQRGPP